jgi:G:T/U-mismatch repair DNA glycosylase
MSNLDWKPETHPNWYRDVPKMKCLILGSFPPHKSKWNYPFYYPNAQNRFWKILAKIAKRELTDIKKITEKEAVEERYEIMCLLNAGVQNMGLKIKRKGNSANDKDIKIEEFQDIRSIIEKHNKLEKILLPGYWAKNSTAKAFLKYFEVKNIPHKNIKPGAKFFINAANRKIECVILNSTSTASTVKEEELLKQFKKHLSLQ